ncbi:NERD domain-containing protein [Clostridium sp.]|uniref:NERD domain-containing protein n=1 Tax=Clostridium sp. TaxID=1506 RepID=UPI001D84B508|nr:NERD domain-containing protein [Clostridium sp.]MBS5985202.1 NERD domain-containing protein [Clostridium sp.]
MSFIKNLLDIREIKGPEFYKDFESENKQLYDLEELFSRVKSEKRKKIQRDIINLKIGLEGERAVSYELKNSFIPMICLHDIRIENAGYVAQMDYILITEYFIMVLETKKLNGDIVINEAGEFIRRFKTKEGKVFKQEGMYSPIAQNERHIRILENFLKGNGIIKRVPIYSTVIIANPKAIINRSKAPYAIRNGIYKYDQITNMLKKKISKCQKDGKMFESHMVKIAEFLLENNKEITFDYNAKYGLTEEDFKESIVEEASEVLVDEEVIASEAVENEQVADNASDLYEEIRKYRYNKSKEEGNKPYFLFNNNTLDLLVKERPKTKEELLKVQGFGQVKVDKYGDDVLNIINKYINM